MQFCTAKSPFPVRSLPSRNEPGTLVPENLSCLTRQLRARRGILMGAGGSRTPHAPPAPSRRARRARAEALKASKGLWCGARYGHGGVRHPRRWSPCVPRRLEVPLRDAEIHPITPSTLGAHVVVVLGPPVVAVGAQGGVVQRTCFGHRPDVRAPAFGGALRDAEIHPITPSTLGARVIGWRGGSVGYQGARNARIAFRRRPPDLPLQYPVPVGHVPSRATQLPLKDLCIHSRLSWPC